MITEKLVEYFRTLETTKQAPQILSWMNVDERAFILKAARAMLPDGDDQGDEKLDRKPGWPVKWDYYPLPKEVISTRDWFAGQALSMLDPSCHDAQELASSAYAIADAMLEARKRCG